MKLTQAWLGLAIGACASGTSAPPTQPARREPVSIATTPTDKQIAELIPAKLEPGTELDKAIASYYEVATTKRTYIMTDKPLYQPGETICDPASGTGGFLLASHDYVARNNPNLDRDQKRRLPGCDRRLLQRVRRRA